MYLKWVTYVRALLCVFTAHAREESLEITVIRAYSCRRVISGEWWLLRTQNSGHRDRPLPSGFDSPEVRDRRDVIARAPPLVTSQYRGTTSEGSERLQAMLLRYACRNTRWLLDFLNFCEFCKFVTRDFWNLISFF